MELHEILICLVIAVIGAALMMGITIGFRKIRITSAIKELEKTREELGRLYDQNPKEYFEEVIEFNSKLRYMKKVHSKNTRLVFINEISVKNTEAREDYEI